MKKGLILRGKRHPWRDDDPFALLHRAISDLCDSHCLGFGRMGRHPAGPAGVEMSETGKEVRKVVLPKAEPAPPDRMIPVSIG